MLSLGLESLKMIPFYVIALFGILATYIGADTPANCTYEDIRGVWTFYEGERSGNNGIDCTAFKGPSVNTMKFELLFPNVAIDELGNKGYWTIIYNQGFEVTINFRKYFAFSMYKTDKSGNTTSYCDQTKPGWSHDVLGKNWACYNAKKAQAVAPKVHYEQLYSSSGEAVVKGSIAKRIPTFVELQKDKTYSWCSCGLSKKQPFCDGAHKNHPLKLQPVRFTATKTGRALLCRCKQTNNRPYCDLSHVKTFIPESIRKVLKIKL